MRRRRFLSLAAGSVALPHVPALGVPALGTTAPNAAAPEPIHPGVWKLTLGTPERITPVSTRRYAPAAAALGTLPAVGAPPVRVTGEATPRGFVVRVPLAPNEMVYGLGLQFQSFS